MAEDDHIQRIKKTLAEILEQISQNNFRDPVMLDYVAIQLENILESILYFQAQGKRK